MSFRFSVIIPTCGRWSLQRTLRSIQDQTLADGDEVLVVTDGPQPLAVELFRQAGLPGCWLETATTHDSGVSQRNRGMERARGDYLLFMDDDDVYAPGAFAAIRAALREAPGRPHLFRMRYAKWGGVLWSEPRVALSNVSTQMIVFPNVADRLGRWENVYGHDHRFIEKTLAKWPIDALVWRNEIIAVLRPHEGGAAAPLFLTGQTGGPRPVEECPFREPVGREPADGTACCRLLQRLAGVEAAERCVVGRDACEACCASSRPSATELNPVVAALLYDLAEEARTNGGMSGCPPEKAAELQRWAELNLDPGPRESGLASVPKRARRPCYYLGREIGFRVGVSARGPERLPVFACHHPAHRETTWADCQRCRDWSPQPAAGSRPLDELVPPPAERGGPPVRRWAVGVTTAPRRQPTLAWTLDSVIRAGWECPRLFVDAGVTVPERFADLPLTVHEGRLGAWPNYYLALAELLMREPHADAYLLVQDDVLLYDREDLRAYLERSLWPEEAVGAVSLFCSRAYQRPAAGWHVHAGRWVWGAQAFVFPRESAKRFVADPLVLEHRWSNRNGGLANIDVVIGEWAQRHGLPVYYPSPSLAEHVGDTSTLWPEATIGGNRKAGRFAGDGPGAGQSSS